MRSTVCGYSSRCKGRMKRLIGSNDRFCTLRGHYRWVSLGYWRCECTHIRLRLGISAYAADLRGGFMVVRFKNDDGSAGYETIDFRETMPAAGNETVRPCLTSTRLQALRTTR
jgi:hypothetical protein